MSEFLRCFDIETEAGLSRMYYGYNDTSDLPTADLNTDPQVVVAEMRGKARAISDHEAEEILEFARLQFSLDVDTLLSVNQAVAALAAGEEISIPQKLQLYGLDTFFDAIVTDPDEHEELLSDDLVDALSDDLKACFQEYVEDGDTIDMFYNEAISFRAFRAAAIYTEFGMPNKVESTEDQRRLAATFFLVKARLAVGALFAKGVDTDDSYALATADALNVLLEA